MRDMTQQLSENRWDQLKRYVGFTGDDAQLLVDALPLVDGSIPRLIDDFYRQIQLHADTRRVLTGGAAQVQRLKGILRQWLRHAFCGTYDRDYLDLRLRIGRRHVEIGLEQIFTFTAMNRLRIGVIRLIDDNWSGNAKIRQRTVDAINKLLDLELAVMSETYREDYAIRLQQTERQQHEREKAALSESLLEAERLAAVGQMAASLAHEIKNPLAGMRGALEIIGKGLDANNPHRPVIAEVVDQIDRLDRIVRDLLSYSRSRPISPRPVQLADLIDKVLLALRDHPQLAAVEIQRDYNDDLPILQLDDGQLEEVVMNLVLNSAQATEGNGRLSISMRRIGAQIRLSFADNGRGMEPATVKRVFEPFYSTQPQGSGLGLSISKRVIDAHGGTISVDSAVGKGTVVTVHLPLQQTDREAKE